MKVKNRSFSTIWLENSEIKIIDQTRLPFEFKIQKLQSLNDFCKAIKDMKVRGAPLIGVAAAFGFAKSIEKNSSLTNIKSSYKKLLKTRPTAVNLKWALDKIQCTNISDKKRCCARIYLHHKGLRCPYSKYNGDYCKKHNK